MKKTTFLSHFLCLPTTNCVNNNKQLKMKYINSLHYYYRQILFSHKENNAHN